MLADVAGGEVFCLQMEQKRIGRDHASSFLAKAGPTFLSRPYIGDT
jgi:hypothetical protein